MTFLEYVFRYYVGPPQGGYWKCPYCDRRNPSVLLNEPKPGCRVKWRCVAAGCPTHRLLARSKGAGDEYDIIRLYHPDERFPQHKLIAADLRAEWEAERAACTDHDTPHLSPPRGRPDEERRHIEITWGHLMYRLQKAELDTDAVYAQLRDKFDAGHFRDSGWFASRLLEYWLHFIEWVEATDNEHMAKCTDPECDWCCCRRRAEGGRP